MMKTMKIIFSLLFISQTALSSIDSPGVDEGVFSGPTIVEKVINDDYGLRSYINTTFTNQEVDGLNQNIETAFQKSFTISPSQDLALNFPENKKSIKEFLFNFFNGQKDLLEKIQKDLFSDVKNKDEVHHINWGITYANSSTISGQQAHTGGLGSNKATKELAGMAFKALQKNISKSIKGVVSSTSERKLPKFIGFFTKIALTASDISITNQLVFALPKIEIPLKEPIVKKLPTTKEDKADTFLYLTDLNIASPETLLIVEFINSSSRYNPSKESGKKPNIPIIIKFGPFGKVNEGLVQLSKQKVKYLPYFRSKDPVTVLRFRTYVDVEIRQLGFVLYPEEFDSLLNSKTLSAISQNSPVFDINLQFLNDRKDRNKIIEAQQANIGVSVGFAALGIRRLINLKYEYEKENKLIDPISNSPQKRKNSKNNVAKDFTENIDEQLEQFGKSEETSIIINAVFNKMMDMIFPLLQSGKE